MPPPPPPPMLRCNVLLGHQTSATTTVQPDRSALLSQIQKGARLKKTETNDRSAPLLGGSAKFSSGENPTSKSSAILIPPGGLFAHGISKLKATTTSTGENMVNSLCQSSQCSGNLLAQNEKDLSKDQIIGCVRSKPHDPMSMTHQPPMSAHENVPSKRFPNDINFKGPAPSPPTNMFSNHCVASSDGTASANAKCAPSVRRSVSQTTLTPKMRPLRPPPSIRPPPPPKSTAALQTAVSSAMQVSAVTSSAVQTRSVRRRQSFGMADGRLTSCNSQDNIQGKLSVPLPPPRSADPPFQNSMSNGFVGSVHINRMSTAPPPPPCRLVTSAKLPPPEVRSPAPPPPPHRFVAHPASQSRSVSNSYAPSPPMRVSSVSDLQQQRQLTHCLSDFENRFSWKFKSVQYFPVPQRFSHCVKSYPSKINMEKGTRRQPPPPPPFASSHMHGPSYNASQHHQPMLHIQLESRVFTNNSAHC